MVTLEEGEIAVSRAINVKLDEADVIAKCGRKSISISAIEVLPGGGTRVVLNNMDDATVMHKAFGRSVIKGAVRRTNFIARRHV